MKVSKIPKDLFVIARSKSNPYEGIYKSRFKNNDAIKLANLDKIADIFQTESSHQVFLSIGKSSGFAEYIFFRTMNAKGFGINVEDGTFKDDAFQNISVQIDWKDISSLSSKVLLETEDKVDFISAMTDV